jgi:hypothetical protein
LVAIPEIEIEDQVQAGQEGDEVNDPKEGRFAESAVQSHPQPDAQREGVPGAQEGQQDPDGVARAEREDAERGAEQSEGATETGLRDADEQHGQDGEAKGRPVGILEEMHGDGLAWKGGGWKEIMEVEEVGLRERTKAIESATK